MGSRRRGVKGEAGCDDGGVSDQARAVFRITPLAILGAVLLAVCATPVAFGAPYFWLVYLLPVAVVVWVVRVRTVVDAEALTVRRLVGSRRVPWSQIRSLHLRECIAQLVVGVAHLQPKVVEADVSPLRERLRVLTDLDEQQLVVRPPR
jgi:hypothetical protein